MPDRIRKGKDTKKILFKVKNLNIFLSHLNEYEK